MSITTKVPDRVQTLRRSIEADTISTNKRKMTATGVWSTDAGDLYSTAFVQSGCDFSHWEESGTPILYEHGQSAERGVRSIATATEWGLEKVHGRNAIVGTAKFHEGDSFSEARFADVAAGRIRCWSIRALPLDVSPPSREESRARPDWSNLQAVIRSWKLLEVSLVQLPGGVGCVNLATGRGIAGPDSPGGAIRLTRQQEEALVRELLKEYDRRNKMILREVKRMLPDIRLACRMAALRQRQEGRS